MLELTLEWCRIETALGSRRKHPWLLQEKNIKGGMNVPKGKIKGKNHGYYGHQKRRNDSLTQINREESLPLFQATFNPNWHQERNNEKKVCARERNKTKTTEDPQSSLINNTQFWRSEIFHQNPKGLQCTKNTTNPRCYENQN